MSMTDGLPAYEGPNAPPLRPWREHFPPWAFALVLAFLWSGIIWLTWPPDDDTFGVWILGTYWWWFALAVWVLALIGTAVLVWMVWQRALAVALAVLLVSAAAWAVQPLSPRMFRFDSQDWFEDHRADFAETARLYGVECCSSYMGRELVDDLRYLSVNGRVVRSQGGLFLPQWFGIPDDAGGYWYLENGTPAGFDMYGMTCKEPVDLGAGWWACGIS